MTYRRQLKANARQAMRQARPSPFWITLAVTAVLAVLTVLAMSINGDFDLLRTAYEEYMTEGTVSVPEPEDISVFASLLVLALQLMSMVLSVGYTLYTLRVSRRERASFGEVFDAFGIFFRAVWLTVLENFILSFSMMVYLVPAMLIVMLTETGAAVLLCLPLLALPLMVMYSFRLAVFIMLDNPALPCVQCLMLSGAAMRGRKWELFKLDLSFLGWYILSIVPFVGFYVRPYTSVTTAGYYDGLMPGFIQKLREKPAQPWTPVEYHTPGRPEDGGGDGDHNGS